MRSYIFLKELESEGEPLDIRHNSLAVNMCELMRFNGGYF